VHRSSRGLSDQFGRRPVLLTTLFLLALDYAVMAWAPTLAWLVAGRMMSGIMGASWAAANSCIADCIPSYLLLAFATGTPMVIAAIMVGALTGMTFSAMQSLMMVRVSEDAQGELQGAIANTVSLTSIIGPVKMTQIFGHFADSSGLFFPGAPYLVSLALLTVAIGLLWRTMRGIGPAVQHVALPE